jgi:glycosyltransferase involved in cell wall biosynthesis
MISIALPVVKTKFLSQSISSILHQSFTDFELIIVNNGSPENVKEIVDQFDDKRIRYIAHPEMYPIVENWNRCLSYAKRKYFVLFSDDDTCEKDFLKELITLAEKYPQTNLFHTRVRIIDDNNNTLALSPSCPEFESAADFVWHRIKNYRLHYAPDFMCNTARLREIGGFVNFPNAWGSDDATWFEMANSGGVVSSSKILCNWRDSNYNLTKSSKLEPRLIALTSFFKWLEDFIDNRMVVYENEKEIFDQIKKNLNFRKVVQFGLAFQLSVPRKYSSIFSIFFKWLRYKKKYSLSIFSAVWAQALLIKDLRLRK